MTSEDRRPSRTYLEHLIRQRDQTYEEVARSFTDVGNELNERGASMSARHLRRLAAGERSGTTPMTRRILRAMFGHPAETLLGPVASGLDRLQPGGNEAPRVRSADLEEEVLEVAARRARQFAAEAGQAGISGESIDQVHDDLRHLVTAYQRRSVLEILSSLADTQDFVFSLLEARTKPAQARQLYFYAATVSGLLAKVSHDHAVSHTAMTHARTAYVCADNADHPGLRAWIRGLESLISYWAGRPQEAIAYAQAGLTEAETARSSAGVWLRANEARAWAALGNESEATTAIQRADDLWADVTPDELDELGGICTFSRTKQLYYAADALAWLPSKTAAAERYATDAIDAYADPATPDWSFSDLAGSQIDLAIARISRGEIEGASEAAATVLNLPAEQRINGIIASTQRLQQTAVRSNYVSESRDLLDEIEAFGKRPLAALTDGRSS